MIFNNDVMLLGLIALAVPILIHLLNRSRAKVLDWGAMRFLLASLTSQNRRILVEEIILLALRCLLVGLVVLAMAQPRVTRGSSVPWAIVLPAFLAAMICLGVAAAMWSYRKARWILLGVALALVAVASTSSAIEKVAQELKWAGGRGERDVAILLDASMSMMLNVEGKTNFERALDEARSVIQSCKPGDAVSVILAGPVPRPIFRVPTANHQEVVAALAKLQPLGGTMSVLDALNAAAASLAEGSNAAKKIVLITDGQNVGWDVRSDARWRFLAEGLQDLPTVPQIICRRLDLPKNYRNAAVADIAFSRKVVGSDRPVKIDVKVVNTGTVAIRPAAVALTIDNAPGPREAIVTDIQPKAAETVRFEHTFARPGPRLVSARIEVQDDLAADNASSRVLNIVDRLPVLLVDGAASDRPLGGAAVFLDIALTPRSEEEETPPPEGDDGAAKPAAEDVQFLVEPVVKEPSDLTAATHLRDYAVIVLADVATLPDAVANALVSFVERGGGLLVAPGDSANRTFYNGWRTTAERPVLPARLLDRCVVADNPARLEPKTFRHPALDLLAASKRSDIATALVKSYWKLDANEKEPGVRVGARLHTGEPFLVERRLGKGFVMMTAASLDARGSNLPSLKSFVPFAHEIVYYLAAPMMVDANVPPGSEALLELRERAAADPDEARGTGLRAEYFRGRELRRLEVSRVDATVDFDWGDGRPLPALGSDDFSARWTGWVQAPATDRYTFHVEADDGVRLWVDGRRLIDEWKDQSATEYRGSIDLRAGRKYTIKMEYYERAEDATARLLWSREGRRRKEAIPTSCLYPAWHQPAAKGERPGEADAEVVEVVTPSQRRFPAKVSNAGGTLRVSFADTQEPGLYALVLPPSVADIYAPNAGGGATLPFVVLSKVEESYLDMLTEADMGMAGQHVDLFETDRTDELTAAVTGEVPGDDLWKYLAIGALLALVGEVAVTRWIAVQRRLNTTETIAFGSEAIDVQTFRERAKELLATPSQPTETVPTS